MQTQADTGHRQAQTQGAGTGCMTNLFTVGRPCSQVPKDDRNGLLGLLQPFLVLQVSWRQLKEMVEACLIYLRAVSLVAGWR